MSGGELARGSDRGRRRPRPGPQRPFDDLIAEARIAIVPHERAHAERAPQAYRSFGKGSGQPANLNLGDCFAYALSRTCGEPLLYVGDDFSPDRRQPGRLKLGCRSPPRRRATFRKWARTQGLEQATADGSVPACAAGSAQQLLE